MVLALGMLLVSLAFVSALFGGSLTLNGLSMLYTNGSDSLLIAIESYWEYSEFLDLEIPIGVFLIEKDGIPILRYESNILTLAEKQETYDPSTDDPPPLATVATDVDFLSDLPNAEEMENLKSAQTREYARNTITPYGAILVGGGDANEDGYVDDTDGDGFPDEYDYALNNSTRFSRYTNTTNADDDNDGIPDFNEYPYDINANTHYLLPDSDFDGLNDTFERTDPEGYGLNPAEPDVIVEVDYTSGSHPNTMATINFWSVIEIILIVATVALAVIAVAVALISKHPASAKLLVKIAIILGAVGVLWGLFLYPREPFTPIKEYFKTIDINLHIIIDDELTVSGSGVTISQATNIESTYHDIPYAVYSCFVESISYDSAVGVAWYFGAFISTNSLVNYANVQQKIFGHELGHCLDVTHHENDKTYQDEGYESDWCNYMAKANPCWFGTIHFDAWQICSFNLNEKWST